MKYKISTKYAVNITNILFFGTIMSGVGRIFFSNDISLILYATFSLVMILNELRYLKFTAPLVLFVFLLLFVFLMLWMKMIMGLNSAFYIIHHFIIGSFLAHAIFRGSIKKQTALLIFFIVAGYFIYNLTFVDVSGETSDEIMQKRNSISVLVISCLMVLVFLHRQGNASAPLIPAFTYVIVSIGATGRSGIISSLIIFGAMLFNSYNLRFTGIKRIIGYFAIITVAIAAIFIYWEDLMNMTSIMMPYLASKGLKDEARTYMIMSYLQKITPLSLIFGVDLESIHFLTQYNYNPHNSYIKLHAVLGIVSFLFYIPLVYYLFKELLARHVVYVICILAYLFRIGTDSVVGSNVLSFVFLTLILYGLNSAVTKPSKNLTNLLRKKTNSIVAKTASDHG